MHSLAILALCLTAQITLSDDTFSLSDEAIPWSAGSAEIQRLLTAADDVEEVRLLVDEAAAHELVEAAYAGAVLVEPSAGGIAGLLPDVVELDAQTALAEVLPRVLNDDLDATAVAGTSLFAALPPLPDEGETVEPSSVAAAPLEPARTPDADVGTRVAMTMAPRVPNLLWPSRIALAVIGAVGAVSLVLGLGSLLGANYLVAALAAGTMMPDGLVAPTTAAGLGVAGVAMLAGAALSAAAGAVVMVAIRYFRSWHDEEKTAK